MAIVGLLVGVGLGRLAAPDFASQISAARGDAAPIVTALEVMRDEYPKLLGASAGGDPGGAEAALKRASELLVAHEASWLLIDPDASARLADALGTLSALVARRAPDAEVQVAIDAAQSVARSISGLNRAR